MKSYLAFLLLLLAFYPALSQKGTDIIHSEMPITWLGLDFSQTRFIGPATQFQNAGEVTADAIRDKYIPAWNALFLNEPKKYNVSKYVHRETVAFSLDMTSRSNSKVGANFFSQNPADYSRLTESDIARIVKNYDFMGRTGVGLIFFVEGISKGKEEASAWITFIDMEHKTVLQTHRATGSGGGFGLRNYWAKAFLNILKETDSR